MLAKRLLLRAVSGLALRRLTSPRSAAMGSPAPLDKTRLCSWLPPALPNVRITGSSQSWARMRLILLALSVAVASATMTACGADSDGSRGGQPHRAKQRTATTHPFGPYRFARAPIVYFRPRDGDYPPTYDVYFRVDKALPTYKGSGIPYAILRLDRSSWEEGIDAVLSPRYPCYSFGSVMAPSVGRPYSGKLVSVSVIVSGEIHGAVQDPPRGVIGPRKVRLRPYPRTDPFSDLTYVHVARRLGCFGKDNRDEPTRCPQGLIAQTPGSDSIGVASALRTTCEHAQKVLQRLAPSVDTNKRDGIGVSRHRLYRGYRCAAKIVGEADWEIRCRRGSQEIVGFIGE